MEVVSGQNITFLENVDEEAMSVDLRGYKKIMAVILFSVVALLGTAGNAMVVVAVALSRKLQTAANIYIVALAVTDFLTAVNQIIQVILLLDQGKLPSYHALCATVGVLNVIFVGYSVSFLLLIAINRYKVITKSINYRLCTKTAAAGIVGVLVFVSLFIGTVYALEEFLEGGEPEARNDVLCSYSGGFYMDIGIGVVLSSFLTVICCMFTSKFFGTSCATFVKYRISIRADEASTIVDNRLRLTLLNLRHLTATDKPKTGFHQCNRHLQVKF